MSSPKQKAPSSSSSSAPPSSKVKASAKKAQAARSPTSIFELLPSSSDSFTILATLVICAISSFASQLSLSPVFGGIPSALHHAKLKNTAFAAATCLALGLKYTFPRSRVLLRLSRFIIPLIAVNIPIIQGAIWQHATELGAVNGPIVIEAATVGLLLVFTVFSITGSIRPVAVPVQSVLAADITLLSISYFIFTATEKAAETFLSSYVGSGWPMTRCGMEATAAIFAASLHRSIFLLAAVPSFIPIFYLDSRCMMGEKGVAKLNEQLAAHNYTLATRIESNTGYLSVLENTQAQYRILRCDHSILGGVWTKPVPGIDKKRVNPRCLKEPIYAVFLMLEAVRLVDPPEWERLDPKALVIGLGIGTSASGMIQHGIKTHIVEIDPGVYHIAKEYFGLPRNHTVHIGDAVAYVRDEYLRASLKGEDVEKYDYILHDVFTGGAVPEMLFTWEFLEGLKSFLTTNGVIAINYAGDIKLKSAKSVIHTIERVFGTCRAFREYQQEKDSELGKGDFTNMVIYCTPFHKPRADPRYPYLEGVKVEEMQSPFFHKPEPSDFLNTWARHQMLMPKFEVDLTDIRKEGKEGKLDVVSIATAHKLREWQKQSAILHWEIMNTVIPQAVWSLY
ncbi:hypothetical protein ABW20_dc0104340 [Dactylellina cionopaga]|nr:hypothetical protein ABW20_dc0104340 [Dactylellina cionopaga]